MSVMPIQGGSINVWGDEVRAFFSPTFDLNTGAFNIAQPILFSADNLYDIGSPTFKPRSIYAGTSLVFGSDTVLQRDSANVLALRNGINPQNFNLYNTFTDSANYERLQFQFSSNQAQIITGNGGTGVARELGFGTGNSLRWKITTAGHFLAQSDNTYDIGSSGANRPRNLYISSNLIISGTGSPIQIAADAANPLSIKKSTVAVGTPGASFFTMRIETGTNAGTLKLVAYAGTSITGVTIIDNVGAGN